MTGPHLAPAATVAGRAVAASGTAGTDHAPAAAGTEAAGGLAALLVAVVVAGAVLPAMRARYRTRRRMVQARAGASPRGAFGGGSFGGASGRGSRGGASGGGSFGGASGRGSPGGASGRGSSGGASGRGSPRGASGRGSPRGASGGGTPGGASGGGSPGGTSGGGSWPGQLGRGGLGRALVALGLLAGVVAAAGGVRLVVAAGAGLGVAAIARRRHQAALPARWRRAQLPEALDRLAATLRGGASVPVAIADVGGGFPAPLGPELAALGAEAAGGRPTADVLDAWASAHDDRGTRLAATALVLAGSVGAAPARAADGVAATLRERADLADERHALAAQARMSAVVLSVAPIGFAALLSASDAGAQAFLLGSPAGWACLATGLVLDAAGAAWMTRLTRGRDA